MDVMHWCSSKGAEAQKVLLPPQEVGEILISSANKTLLIPNMPSHYCDTDNPMPTTLISSCILHGHFYVENETTLVCLLCS